MGKGGEERDGGCGGEGPTSYKQGHKAKQTGKHKPWENAGNRSLREKCKLFATWTYLKFPSRKFYVEMLLIN